jgi:hypothetical protein
LRFIPQISAFSRAAAPPPPVPPQPQSLLFGVCGGSWSPPIPRPRPAGGGPFPPPYLSHPSSFSPASSPRAGAVPCYPLPAPPPHRRAAHAEERGNQSSIHPWCPGPYLLRPRDVTPRPVPVARSRWSRSQPAHPNIPETATLKKSDPEPARLPRSPPVSRWIVAAPDSPVPPPGSRPSRWPPVGTAPGSCEPTPTRPETSRIPRRIPPPPRSSPYPPLQEPLGFPFLL